MPKTYTLDNLPTDTLFIPANRRQYEVFQRREFEIGIGGMRGGGKTAVGQAWLLDPEYMSNSNYSCLVLRKNSQDLEDWKFKFRKLTKGQIEIAGNPPKIRWPGGGQGILGHLADKNAIDHYVGQEYSKILFEELNLIPTEDEYLKVLASCRCSDPKLQPQTLSTFNPGNVGAVWIKKRFIDVAFEKAYVDPVTGKARIFIRLFLKENEHLDSGYEAYLRGLPPAIRSAWLDGNWEASLGNFFRRFPQLEQPFEIPEDDLNLYAGFDFGNSEKGHSAFIMCHLDRLNVPHLLFTWYHKAGHAAPDQARALKEYVKSFPWTGGRMPKTVYADPSLFNKRNDAGLGVQTKTVASYFQDEGFTLVPANNNRVNGWRICDGFFSPDVITGQDKMRVWDGYNTTLMDDLEIQVPNPNNIEDIEENDHDHSVDGCRYLLVALFSLISAARDKEKREEQKIARRQQPFVFVERNGNYSSNDGWLMS